MTTIFLADQETIALKVHAGEDELHGEGGNDVIIAGAQDDDIFGGPGRDIIEGQADNDYIEGGDDDDTISGGQGDDTIHGQNGDDNIEGLAGDDVVIGGAGHDLIEGGLGRDIILGDEGTVVEATITQWRANGDPASPPSVTLVSGSGNDEIFGEDENDAIFAGAGNDYIEGDRIAGGRGADYIDAGTGDDTVFGTAGGLIGGVTVSGDTIIGGWGADTIIGGTSTAGNSANSLVWNNLIYGDVVDLGLANPGNPNDHDDLIYGDLGPDQIFASHGDDTVLRLTRAAIRLLAAGERTRSMLVSVRLVVDSCWTKTRSTVTASQVRL